MREATTAGIFAHDGYAFAESDVDPGQAFEKFAADCAALTGVVAQRQCRTRRVAVPYAFGARAARGLVPVQRLKAREKALGSEKPTR